ncbi:hypothetical protein Micbo1qcDRAFT_207537 [Microdochium bolleyi]|uniref:Uncharacterized protein n=1 Tax=Microdochium bolleyi TaxID=196109 RepID=A0A136ITX9_9PEZI|nr:hypothetical protein Micbo1qcDRAFT_207537 [Microdochium bolleyi]
MSPLANTVAQALNVTFSVAAANKTGVTSPAIILHVARIIEALVGHEDTDGTPTTDTETRVENLWEWVAAEPDRLIAAILACGLPLLMLFCFLMHWALKKRQTRTANSSSHAAVDRADRQRWIDSLGLGAANMTSRPDASSSRYTRRPDGPSVRQSCRMLAAAQSAAYEHAIEEEAARQDMAARKERIAREAMAPPPYTEDFRRAAVAGPQTSPPSYTPFDSCAENPGR